MTTYCCDNFRHAQILGSDHELLGAAIRDDEGQQFDASTNFWTRWSIGNCANITHCPYCGKILEPPVEEDAK